MSSDLQSVLELIQMNDYASRMVSLPSVSELRAILQTSAVAVVTAVVYDYRESVWMLSFFILK